MTTYGLIAVDVHRVGANALDVPIQEPQGDVPGQPGIKGASFLSIRVGWIGILLHVVRVDQDYIPATNCLAGPPHGFVKIIRRAGVVVSASFPHIEQQGTSPALVQGNVRRVLGRFRVKVQGRINMGSRVGSDDHLLALPAMAFRRLARISRQSVEQEGGRLRQPKRWCSSVG